MPGQTSTGPPLPPKSDHSDTDMEYSLTDQVLLLSNRVKTTEEKHDQILHLLRELKNASTATPPSPSFPLRPASFATATPSPQLRPNVAPPETFDGDRSKGRAFLTSIALYLSLRGSEFANDQDRIKWVLSYMKSGRAATFAQRTMRAEMLLRRPAYATFDDFRRSIEDEFCPQDEATQALMKLESEGYYQGARSVNAYIDEFQELVGTSGLVDPVGLVMKFRRGLDPKIQHQVAVSDAHPDNSDLDGWLRKAKRIYESRQANAAFESSNSRRITSTPRPYPAKSIFPPPTPPKAVNYAPSTTRLPLPDSRHRPNPNSDPSCGLCGIPGHTSQNCYVRRKIRGMTSEDRNAWISSLCAEVDVADADDRSMIISDESETVVTSEEDFAPCSE
jgi:hypothetical protein